MPYHYTLKKNKTEFELHRYPPGVKRGEKGEYLKSLFYDAVKRAEQVSLGEYSFPVFPALENGMVLLLHIVKHLKEGLGLRQIIDWMMYVNRCLDDRFWEEEFRPVAETAGLSTLAKVITKLCQLHLGLRCDGITWCRDADDAVCEELLAYFMEQGNFGEKIGRESDGGAQIMTDIHGPIQFFRMMQRHGCERWEAVRKHPWLKCVAWLYQAWGYIKKLFTRKGMLKKWSRDVAVGQERGKLFDKLSVYEK